MEDLTEPASGVMDLTVVSATSAALQPAWSHQGTDLNVNLIVLDPGDGIEEHVNGEVEVLLVGIVGTGAVTIDGERHAITPGVAVVVAKGARRAIRAGEDRFAYLTCHRRRAGLRPTTRR